MPVLTIGPRTFAVSDARRRREAERMFRMSPQRRAHRLNGAKSQLARAAGAAAENTGAAKRAAAVILSQAIVEI